MKVILVFVTTINGKITRGGDPEVRHWSSKDDKEHYSKIWRKATLVVMGSNTFNKNIITPFPGRLIVVMTGTPEKYKEDNIAGQLEFTDESPSDLVKRFQDHDIITVVGGSKIASSFLKESLVDELILTIEPLIFGNGIDLFSEGNFEVRLKMLNLTRMNNDGTLIIHYKVLK